jgi:hypothetical protein
MKASALVRRARVDECRLRLVGRVLALPYLTGGAAVAAAVCCDIEASRSVTRTRIAFVLVRPARVDECHRRLAGED